MTLLHLMITPDGERWRWYTTAAEGYLTPEPGLSADEMSPEYAPKMAYARSREADIDAGTSGVVDGWWAGPLGDWEPS